MINSFELQKLVKKVKSARRVLITSHKDCGDATGSSIAAYLALQQWQVPADIFLPGPVPAIFKFLPHTEKIITNAGKINLENYDVLFCVDAAEIAMTGLEDKWKARPIDLTTINSDHHFTNPGYGDINILDKQASATAVVLLELFKQLEFTITREIATCLLTGIFTDTGTFSNPGTTALSLKSAADLLLKGANAAKTLDKIARTKSVADLQLWGRALERLYVNESLNVVTTVITLADMKELKVGTEALEGIANFLNDLSGFRAALVLKEQADGTVKGSLRTTRDDVDVAAMAAEYGGGGHKKAAGFTVKGSLVETPSGWTIKRA
ncbi:TPA: hypothetical protein DIC39_01415 [Patescibacteria group bacterium]|nr:hypothetical protein [Patescibacteria group bacterium]HCU47699.1 hypothetical protein [Patescibacteria group bacterium]